MHRTLRSREELAGRHGSTLSRGDGAGWSRLSLGFGRRSRSRVASRSLSSKLGLETLEARQLLAADVIVNEIHHDPDVKTELVEFIELYNAGDEIADLSGWSLADAVAYEIPAGTTLAPDQTLVVSQSPDALATKFDGVTSLGPYEGKLASSGETIRLLDAADNVIDEVDYQLGFPWPTVGEAPGYSIELIHPSLDNQLGGSWRASVGNQTIFGEQSTWSYFKGTSEPSDPTDQYRQSSFDDSGWDEGAGPFGSSSRIDFGTELSDMRNNYSSLYLRKSFDVEDVDAIGSLTLSALYGDGINVWINGTYIAGENVFEENLAYNFIANSSRSSREYENITLPDPSAYLQPGQNVIAIQLLNNSLSDRNAYFDAALLNTTASAPGPSPGQINSVYADNSAPQMRQVDHRPNQPQSGEDVAMTVKVTDSDGLQSVTLDYQLVAPGDYIDLDDPRYQTEWTTVAMRDDGTAGDETAGDGYYTTVLPGELQTHRRLVRYRVTSTDTLGNSVTGPYADDPQPNFAYYVYDRVPDWTGSAQPGAQPEVTYSSDLLESLPVYQLITTHQSHVDSQFISDSEARSGYGGADYPWAGTLVYDGVVYDHIHFRARGGVWRYAMGKNMWKFDFNRGHSFQARDDDGNRYDTTWDKLNFSALIQQGDTRYRGEQGLFESVGFELFELAGTESPNTSFVHFRIVENADENGADQYSSDFQGMYLAIEQPDGRFLDEHGLPDGNFYKIEGNSPESTTNQSALQVDDASDAREFISAFRGNASPDVQWWNDNLDLEKYYGYQAISQGIHHYDVAFGKNFYYFNNPETGKWQIHPWDLDLTWDDSMYGNENHEFNVDVAKNPDFNVYQLQENIDLENGLNKHYQNRTREILDLLYNQEQTGMMLDQYASYIYTPGEPSLVDADRAMWDYNPIIAQASRYTNPSKNGQSHHYYEKVATRDFPGMVQILKDYVDKRNDWINNRILTNEENIPHTPTVSYAGPERFPVNGLTFQTTEFASPIGAEFTAIQWRLAEITDPNDPGLDPYDDSWRRRYEIEADWESGELSEFGDNLTIAADDVEVGRTYRVRVRMKDSDGHWSHWSEPAQFVAGPLSGIGAESLRITEINYNPYPGSDAAVDNDQYEFIELANVGATALNLNGIRFADGIDFDFTDSEVTSLEPGARVVVVRNLQAFASRYGAGISVAGQFDNTGLRNSGEEIALVDGSDNTILQFSYSDSGAWSALADGFGSSLELIDAAGSQGDATNWRASTQYGGSPGRAGIEPIHDVVINEVLSNSQAPQTDTIELHNITGTPIDVGGWLLSNSLDNVRKFTVPAGTTIPAGGYVTFNESHFNRSGDPSKDFALDGAHGDEVWLVQADSQGNIARFVDSVQFPSAALGVSFGRTPDGQGDLQRMDQLTLGDENSRQRVGEVIVSELHYHPLDMDGAGRKKADDFEFIELYNRTDAAIDLGQWHMTGINHTFDAGTTIDAGATILLVPFNPNSGTNASTFRFLFGIASDVPLVRFRGDALSDEGGTLRLERPETPSADDPDFSPTIPVDEVVYRNAAPWPTEAAGTGQSLTRISSVAYGHLANSWSAADPSPGTFDAFTRQPGDANEDGQFDQIDIILVAQAGKYLTGQPATWAQGDWNEDGTFNQLDIVASMRAGLYLQGAYAAEGDADASNLRVSEIDYNPHAPYLQFGENDTSSDNFEFIELMNVGTAPIDLAGVEFIEATIDANVEGVVFKFGAQTLAPGERIVVVRDRAAFQSRYGNSVRIAAGNDGVGGNSGEYDGKLSDGGEQLTLVDKNGGIIGQFSYNDSGSWPGRADGNGSSLEVLDTAGDYDDGDNWRSSSEFGGTPGATGLGPDNRLVFNEILAHTDPPDVDMIELFNTTETAVNMTNWYISDSSGNYLKYKISTPTTVAAGGYQVFTETQFGDALGGLSSYEGEELWLIEAGTSGKPVRFVDRVGFGASENSVSFGRWPNGDGRLFPMAQLTLGSENTGPKPGDVVISELHYNPVDPDGDGLLDADQFEFIELHNRSISAVDLTNWQLDGGVGFTFPGGTLISPGETVVLVPFVTDDAAQVEQFRSAYGITPSVRLIGPYEGKLGNGGDTIRLEWPDEPPSEQPDFIPWILEDRVSYNDKSPWPTTPDGAGDSLARVQTEAYGGFAESWTPRTPNPGQAELFARQAGDSNEDRAFNQLDLILALQGQKYDTGEVATWRQGDWDRNGKFDRFDIIKSQQIGLYLQGPYEATSGDLDRDDPGTDVTDQVFDEVGRT